MTEEQIAEWQSAAREGFDVEGLRGRGRPRLGADGPSAVIPVRMDKAMLEELMARAERDGLTRSEAIRAAVKAWSHAV
ncbi:MAG: ribbon-helix-helix domain-containing protein [Micropruina sp.]|uniref:ribbon-helix-helix domain-containing protein n=1 Tax=Micropruina sp. TaxID=2737536 RepID=UPI0039E43CC7